MGYDIQAEREERAKEAKRTADRRERSLFQCKDCGKEISKRAEICPGCGSPVNKGINIARIAIALASFLVLIIVYATLYSNKEISSLPALSSLQKQIVTFAEYQQIENGMSYSQVVDIIGDTGQESSRNHIDGVPGVMDSTETVMYQWINSNGSNMNAMFQNDKLMQKAQFGLK